MQLIPFNTDHFSTLASWFSNEADVVQWGGPLMRYPLDAPQLQALLDECQSDPPRRMCWMAVDGDQLIGHVELGLDWRNGNAVVQRVAITPAFRGRGLAVPMLRLLMEQAFAFPQIVRLELNVYTFNVPAVKTYEKLGFLHEGTRRSSTLVGNERWDTAVMAVLRDEYQSP